MKKLKKTFMIIFVLLITGFISTAQNEKIPVTSSSDKAVQLYHQAWSVMENAEIAKAHQLLEDALKEDPDFFMGHFALAFNNLYLGNRAVFKEHAEMALNSKAQLSKGEMLLKTALRRLNENPKSDVTDVGENLVEIYPSDVVAYYMLASFQGFANDLKGTASTYNALLEITDNPAPVYNMLGYTYLRMNDYRTAEKSFDKYIELAPDHPNPQDSKGDYYMAVKDYENAYNSFMKAHELDNAWGYKKAMKAKELLDLDNYNATEFQANGLSEKEIADIHALLKAHEKNALASDWVADAQLYTEDAIRFPPGGEPIKGRKAIQSALESIESVSSFTHEILEVNGYSNIAYVIVKYSFTAKQVESSETSAINGKSLNILKKQSDNTWKLHRVLWN